MNAKQSIVAAIVLFAVIAALSMSLRHWSGESAAQVANDRSSPPVAGKELWHCGMHPQVIQDHPGTCPICHMALTPLVQEAPTTTAGEKKILYWWDPMLGTSSIADGPGKSAMGMDRVPVYETSVSGGLSVTIDPTVVQNMGVRTALVTRGPLDVTIRTVGMLKAPQPELHEVSLRVGGWIEKLYADTEGMHVHAGEVLFDLYSPDLQVASEELIAAVRARKSLETSANDTVRKDADGLVDSAKRKFKLWGIAENDIDAIANADRAPNTVPMRSPADGAVVENFIVQGSAVQAGMKLLRIEGHSRLWLDADVYEGQLESISLGQTVEATFDAIPGQTFAGKVSIIYPHVDHMTRTETARTTLDNPELKLKPGMYATVRIIARPVMDAVLAPREAVIDTGTRKIAFIAEALGHFTPRNVKTGLSGDNDQIQILEGLAPGESVVTSGQFLMDVESRTAEAIEKLRPAQPTSTQAASTQPVNDSD